MASNTSSELSLSNTSNNSSLASESDNNDSLDLTNDIIDNYNVITLLGKGSYSKVWLVYNINDMKYYALKVMNAGDYNEGKEELNIMKQISSDEKYINRLKHYFIETRFVDNDTKKFLCLVYDLCCGNLDGLSRKGKYKAGYPINMAKVFLKQTLEALYSVHYRLNGFHGDIKPDNILLCGLNNRDMKYINQYDKHKFNDVYSKIKKEYCGEKKINKLDTGTKHRIRKKVHCAIMDTMGENNENPFHCNEDYFLNPHIKLTDFGFFCKNTEKYDKPFGTRYYMAPEIILMGECDEKVDIWALGCMLYELVTGEILFDPHSSKRGSTDFHHLEMIISMCGEFNKSYIERTKYYKKFFKNGKLKDMIYTEDYNVPLVDKLNKRLKDNGVDDMVLCRLIASMLNLIPSKRPSIKELLKNEWLIIKN